MNTRQRNEEQIRLSKTSVNRYYFNQHYGRDPKEGHEGDVELLLYFITYGGAKDYAIQHQQEEDK